MESQVRRSPPSSYNSYRGKVGKISPNRLKRRFKSTIPHQKLTTDFSEFNYYENGEKKKLYLIAYLDLFNSEIISFEISQFPSFKALNKALKTALDLTSDCPYRRTFHSDQGWTYQVPQYYKLLKKHHIYQSMSRKGNCFDNSVMENFFGLIKKEVYHGKTFKSFHQLKSVIEAYIFYYNTTRIKKKLDWKSPTEFRIDNEKKTNNK